MKKALILVISLAIAVACLGFAGGGKETPKAATAGAKVNLEYWIAGDPYRTKVYQASIDEFMKANPNLNVTVIEEVGDNAQIQQKLLTMIASGTSPDVIHVDTMYVEDMARAGTILPLDGFPGSKELAAAIFPGAQEPLAIDGKIYGYPIRANSIQLVYNKKLFKEAGLDPDKPPKTFDELVSAAIKLTKKDKSGNVEVFGLETGITKDPHWTAHAFTPILWSYGGSYVGPDGKAGFGGEAGIKAANLWKKLVFDLKVSPTDRPQKAFETGKVAMAITGEWSIKPFTKDFPDLDWGFTTLPVAAAGVKPMIPLGGRATVLPKGIKNPNDSWKLIQWVMSKPEQMRSTSNEVGLTPRLDLVDDPWFNTNPKYKHSVQDMQFVKPKAAPDILQMNTILANGIQKAVLLGEDTEKSMKEAAEKYNELLAKRKK
jgi:multiple sugar transport system substrate-binding protein